MSGENDSCTEILRVTLTQPEGLRSSYIGTNGKLLTTFAAFR
jgi:hypothetical protein